MNRAQLTGPLAEISPRIICWSSFTGRRHSATHQDHHQGMAKIDAFFNLMMQQKASDLHLASGNNPMLRINGELKRVDYPPLKSDELKAMLYEIAPDMKIKVYEETGDVDFGYEIPTVARFRANFFNQKNGVSAVFRQIPATVLSFEDFESFDAPLPPVLKKMAMLNKI